MRTSVPKTPEPQDQKWKGVKEPEDIAKEELLSRLSALIDGTEVKGKQKALPVRFKDAIGGNYKFHWERCHKWRVS